MSIKQRFFNWLAADSGIHGKEVTLTSSNGWSDVYRNSWIGGDTVWNKDAEKLGQWFTKSGLVHACIDEKARSVSSAELQVGTIKDGIFEPIEHEVLGLFYDNEDYSYSQIMELFSARLDLSGAAYSLLSQYENRFGVGGLTPLPTQIVGKKAKGASVQYYEIRTSGDPIRIEKEEMAALEYLDPNTFQGITSPTKTILRELGVDTERQQITMEILRNKALPGLFMRPETSMNPAQQRQLRDSLNATAGGETGNRGSVTVLPSKISVEKGADVTDIDFEVLNGLTESRICMAYQVPPILIAAKVGLESSTYSNYEQARQSFYKETIKPLWSFISSGLTRSILSRNAETRGLAFRFDESKVPELQEDMNEATERATKAYEKGVAKRDEARVMINLPEVGGEEGGFRPTVEPQPAIRDEVQMEDAISAEGKSIDGKIGQTEKAPAAIGSFPEAVALEQTLKRQFAKQLDLAIEQLAELGYINMDIIGKGLGEAIETTLLAVAQQEAMKVIREVGAKCSKSGIKGKEAQLIGAFDVVNPELERRISEQSIKLSQSTLATTQQNLDFTLGALREELVKEGVRGVNTLKALTEGVKRVFENASDSRARTIATTETSRALNDAKVVASAGTGLVVGYTPVVSPDACELCQVYTPSGSPTGIPLYPYTNTKDALGQVGEYEGRSLPPYHPNCRCTSEPILVNEAPPAEVKQPTEDGGSILVPIMSGLALQQLGQRKAETPRQRPGGRPETAQPLRSFISDAVEEVKEDD